MGRTARGWAVMRAGYPLLMAEKRLLLIVALGAVCEIVAALAFLTPLFRLHAFPVNSEVFLSRQPASVYALVFAFYFTASCVSLFFGVVLMDAALRVLRGEHDGLLRHGLETATRRLAALLVYALIDTTVGLVLRTLHERLPWVGRYVTSALGIVWSVSTFFVLPVLVVEGVGPLRAIRRSGTIIRRTWGESVTIMVSTGMVLLTLWLPAMVLFCAFALAGNRVVFFMASALIGAYLSATIMITTAAEQIFRAVLYRWTQTGETPCGYDASVLGGALVART